jgi:tRNA A-37 threonylcarbamoyl transferase component Bud32
MKQGGSSTAVHEALWFNSYRSVTCFVDEHWFIFNDQAGLPMSIMYALVVDSVGYVYVGTGDKGLYRTTEPLTIELLQQYIRDNNSMTGRTVHRSLFQPYWNTSLGASKDEIKELLWQNGTLWVGMTDAIVAFKDGNLNAKEVVQPANTSVAVEGYCGTYNPITKSLWFSFGKGLIEIDPATKRIIRSVTKENGLLSNEANWLEGIDADKNGMVYLAHPNGMSAYQPSLDQKNELEAPLVFRRAAYSEDSFGNNEFAVEYAALSFANERLVKYRTRLTGYDKLWSSEKTDSRIRYTNLSAFFFTKDYVFEVIACNNSGVWSTKPLQYRVTVFPPWWFRWWTFFIYLAGAFGIVRSTKWAFENIRLIIANTKARYISHYKTLELLGQGGMGKVHKAMDIHTRQIVALKVLHPDLLKDTENRKRLAAEGHILSSFHHPNIVRVLEVGESREQGFITMEFISGGTLKQLLNHAHPLPLTEIKRMLLQICAGIVEVHAHGIVHRDLKTGNMMLDAEGNIRIMDFGLSKTPLVTTMTSLGTVLGTLGYVAPEQVTNQHVDKRTDIFSLGVIIYELLTNTMPFKGENEIALIHSIFNITPLPPSSLRPDVTTEWDSLTAKCIAKNIADRFQSVEDVLQKVHLL